MADSKVTDFSAATSVNTADVLYLIQGNNDRKISISTLLANLPNTLTNFKGVVAIGGAAQNINNSGTVNNTSSITFINNTSNSNIVLSNGLYDGQIKIIVMTSATNNSIIISNVLGVASITFSRAGATATLMWVEAQNKWVMIGGTATVGY
jgi:hypothetical protein